MASREVEALRRTVEMTRKLIDRPPINAGLNEELEAAEDERRRADNGDR